jgi:hypothetical protein
MASTVLMIRPCPSGRLSTESPKVKFKHAGGCLTTSWNEDGQGSTTRITNMAIIATTTDLFSWPKRAFAIVPVRCLTKGRQHS